MKYSILLLFSLFLSQMIFAQEKTTLLYIGDPMCSWCYGFSGELDEAVKLLKGDVEFELLMGGLRPYNTETMNDLKDFLKEHWEEVSLRTGQKFSFDILEEKDMVYDTEPACRAFVTMRTLHPELSYAYFKNIQHAFYFQNRNPNNSETFVELAYKLGVSREEFKSKMESEEMKEAVKMDFQFSGQLGATSFPTLILKHQDEYFLISRGYAKSEVIVKAVKSVLQEDY